jgi:hypothetical protein
MTDIETEPSCGASYARGYAAAIDDLLAAIRFKVPLGTYGRLKGWQRKVAAWLSRVRSAADQTKHEPPPRPIFTRRDNGATHCLNEGVSE